VHRLLHSNPTFAHLCGFVGRDVLKQPDELTSRRLPSEAVCEEFSEVMTRYGLWHLARVEQVRENLVSGAVEVEDTMSFDTTHIVANSHCANVVPPGATAEDGKKPKHRKVPRMRKSCDCGRDNWESRSSRASGHTATRSGRLPSRGGAKAEAPACRSHCNVGDNSSSAAAAIAASRR